MGRVIGGAVVGAVILFMWGWLAWGGIIPLHKSSFRPAPNQEAVMASLKENLPESGVFYFPEELASDATDDVKDAWKAQHRAGPVGMITFTRDGAEPMPPMMYVKGFGLNFLSALLAAWMLSTSTIRGMGGRVIFVLLLGIFAGVTTDMVYWNWLGTPQDFTMWLMVDHAIAWLLCGIALALIVKPSGAAGGAGGR